MTNTKITRYRKKTSLSMGQKTTIVMIFFLSVAIQLITLVFYKRVHVEKELNAAKIYGESVAAGIELSLNQSLNTTQILRDLYLEYGDNFIKDFDNICSRLIEDNLAIGSLYIAPDGIVRRAYPKEIEESTIGFEMLKDPEQSERALLALSSRQITVAGPHKLVEGGTGFIIRNPIFVDDEFKAFSIVVLDWDEFVKQVLNHVSMDDSGYKFGVWKDNDAFAVTDSNGFIFTDCKDNISRKIDLLINVPNDKWHLSVEPVTGWEEATNIRIELILSIAIVIGINIFVILRQREHAKKIYSINHDSLTGLLQRSAFLIRMDKLLKNNPDGKFHVVAADIKDFKVMNSMYGYEKCDQVLIYLSKCFLNVNPHGLCCRFGSDQFMCIAPVEEANTNRDIISKNVTEIVKNASIPNLNIKYGFYNNIDTSLPASIICDRALLAARSIINNYDEVFSNYEGPISRSNMKKQELESSFLSALANEDFKVWFQPKFDAITEKLVGAEALVRWIKEDGTVISPADFISVFEEDGLIYRLDLYVFRQVCEKMKYWLDKGRELVPISVNVSRVSLQHSNIISEYKKIIQETQIKQELVPLELTESAASDVESTKRLAEEFKAAGFKIHMDDFGSGFSSLGNLNSMPFDEIKLDKSLVDYIGTADGEELLRHTVELVQFKGLKTIAEGVETKEQLEFLKKLNCNHIQGYYFAAPMPYEKFIDFIRQFY